MATKAQIYASLADDTARKITGDYLDWAAFLGTSSRLYKYPYRDQLLSARMQRPVPSTISGIIPCTGTSGAAPRALRC